MPLDLQNDCVFSGPALPLPFVTLNLEAELIRLRLLPRATGDEAKALDEFWPTYRAHLRQLVSQGGPQRVKNQVIEPLLACGLLGYTSIETADDVTTREGRESGGGFLVGADGKRLRFWTTTLNEDLDAPAKRGEAYRFSHARVASRVLLASGERLGILTNGTDLRLLICDPARLDSSVSITLDGSWKRSREVPDSFRFFLALARPEGVEAIAELIEKARLLQAKVTKDLRTQARLAVEEFIQAILDDPENQNTLSLFTDRSALAHDLWHEGLVTVYRLLFILKLESTDDPAKCFSFASGSLWRNSFSPGVALAPLARAVLDRGESTGGMLEGGLRALFRMLESGLQSTELNVRPMSGSLFAPGSTPILSSVRWPEHGVARLLDRLLWTTPRRGSTARERVHYGPLDVEDLGRVYEALLELDPGVSSAPMCRLRRSKLEVVVPAAQGERYRPAQAAAPSDQDEDSDEQEEAEEPEEEETGRGKKTKVEWIEEIPPDRFYLRVGLGRKATGSFYTPHSFVRFLVQETLGPLVERVSLKEDPQPSAILRLKVIDKAMGSGHFLVESCRFLGDALYEAARRCDELASQAEQSAEALREAGKMDGAAEQEQRAADLRQRIAALPDPDDELLLYLPSRAVEGQTSGYSQKRAEVLCKRMVAVHCLYGVDRNPLAVELAKLALWIECHAEGMPLTFLDHRLVLGDSLTGPFFEHLLKYPGSQQPLDDLFTQGLTDKLTAALEDALQHVHALESTVGVTVAEIEIKQAAKNRLDRALAPFKLLAAAWSGGVMLGPEGCDDTAYAVIARTIADTGDLPSMLDERTTSLRAMLAAGLGLSEFPPCFSSHEVLAQLISPNSVPAFSYDLGFPEVFYPSGDLNNRCGFNADLGNPPWEGIDTSNKEFFAAFDFSILDLKLEKDINALISRLMDNPEIAQLRSSYEKGIEATKRAIRQLYVNVNQGAHVASAATPDLYQLFVERGCVALSSTGYLGLVLPSAFHSNEGAAGIRRLLLHQMRLQSCYSFENRRKLFEIDSRFKFAPIVVEAGGATDAFQCRFYLHDDEWLYSPQRKIEQLTYTRNFVQSTTGDSLNFLELRSQADVPVAEAAYSHASANFGELRGKWNVRPTEELHLSKNRWRLVLTSSLLSNTSDDPRHPEHFEAIIDQGALPFYEGKSMHQYTDAWEDRPQFCVPFANMVGKERRLAACRYFRLSFRTIASSTNERSGIFAILPPGSLCSNSLLPEIEPEQRANWKALVLLALANSHPFDWLLRLAVSANITFNFLDPVPVPRLEHLVRFLAHSSLRLTCNHARYAQLWEEQLGEAWIEARAALSWPVLDNEDDRWAVRAAIDAVLAQAYGLSRDHYIHVLGSFSHASHMDTPRLCLAAFDELHSIGLEAFTKKHDPYWDIPLNENLPQPVIDLPIPEDSVVREDATAYGGGDLFGEQPSPIKPRGRSKK